MFFKNHGGGLSGLEKTPTEEKTVFLLSFWLKLGSRFEIVDTPAGVFEDDILHPPTFVVRSEKTKGVASC